MAEITTQGGVCTSAVAKPISKFRTSFGRPKVKVFNNVPREYNSETPIAAGRPDADDLSHAQSFGEKIREKILSVPSINHITDITVPGNYPYIDMIDSKKRLSSVDLIAVENGCLQCGVCAQHCPVGAIDSENSASIDIKKCILCRACIKMCPANTRTIKNDMIKNIALRLSQTCQARKEPIFFL